MGRQVVIFCASSGTIDPKYNEAARLLVRGLHARGYDIVSGGGDRGTMGAITGESIRTGGRHVAIALPGGIGTLDELMETHTLRKLKKYDGAVYALNLDGFYEPLKTLLSHFVATNMTARADIDLVAFPETVEQLLENF